MCQVFSEIEEVILVLQQEIHLFAEVEQHGQLKQDGGCCMCRQGRAKVQMSVM
uniref:Uncharacterized protein n=1 Tax=Anguilla anguilla TaxID=7936 RepID=A0A0E9R365_ANGAN